MLWDSANTDALAQAGVLFSLPLDVLLEVSCPSPFLPPTHSHSRPPTHAFIAQILARVDPLSLRRLSRTSRAPRGTLTGPSLDWIWRASYASTDHGQPPAPEDISTRSSTDSSVLLIWLSTGPNLDTELEEATGGTTCATLCAGPIDLRSFHLDVEIAGLMESLGYYAVSEVS